MTRGHYEDKDGGGSTTAQDLVSSNVQVDVGKRTRTDATVSGPQTGDPLTDNPPVCADKPMDGGDCFLTPERRGFLVSEFKSQVVRTGATYNEAVSMVEMQVLLEKSDSNPLVTFIIGALTGFILGKVGDAIVNTKESVKVDTGGWAGAAKAAYAEQSDKVSAAVRLGPTVNPGPSLKEKTLLAIERLDKAKLERKIESIIDKAKEDPKKLGEQAGEHAVKTKQQESMSYLEIVRAVGERAFDNIRKEMLAGATDAEIVAYNRLFDLEHKMTRDFVTAIRDKLERYLKSGVDQIGRHETNRITGKTLKGEIYASVPVNHDIRVRWRRYLSGYPKELEFVHQRADGGPHEPSKGDVKLGTDDAGNSKPIVAPELWDVAVARHVSLWGKEPETIEIDDSDSDDAKRSMAAKTQKASIARAQVAAEHASNLALSQQQEMDRQKYVRPAPLVQEPKTMFGGE